MNGILKIDYYDNFKCIADKCEMNCCEGNWRIYIDKKTFKKYKELKSDIGKDICSHISYVDRNDYDRYGKIDLNCNGGCSLKDKDGLCIVHKNLGEDYLSNVCRSYPRNVKKINENIEYGLFSSCPEVCRVGIIRDSKITFDYKEEKFKNKDFTNKNFNYNNYYFDMFWNIRSFIIEILQFDKMSLNNKLIAVGIILNNINKYEKDNKDINELINLYSDHISSGELERSINNIKRNMEVSIELLMKILRVRNQLAEDIIFDNACENIKKIFYDEINMNEAIDKYNEIKNNGFNDWLKSNELIFENYLVNSFYNEFYLDNKETVEHIYFKLVLSFSILKFLLMGEFVNNKGYINEDRLVEIMSITSRKIDHDDIFADSLRKAMEEANMNIMAHLTILLKE